jgi:hypothetical protein
VELARRERARPPHSLEEPLDQVSGGRSQVGQHVLVRGGQPLPQGSFAGLEREHLFPTGETIGKIRQYSDPGIDLYFVESIRYTDGFPAPVGTQYLYLVYTKDKGTTWKVLDLACVNLKWLHAIAPAFRDDASVRDLIPD